ncbi:hypothetical protein FDZ73_20360, partial [bacterium]
MSGDGRYIAFTSQASNLVDGDTNGQQDLWWYGDDVFVRDRLTGITQRISVSGTGLQGNGTSDQPSINGDGRYVVFRSWANNLV